MNFWDSSHLISRRGFGLGLALTSVTLALPGLFSCQRYAQMPTEAALALGGEGFLLATSYEQIRERQIASIPAPILARPTAPAPDGESSSVAAGGSTKDLDAVLEDGGYLSASEEAAEQTGPVAGLSDSALQVSDGRGFTYRAQGEYLYVIDEEKNTRVQEINLYDCAAQGGQAVCVSMDGESLAVLYAASAGAFAQSDDYALAAYAAPRTLVLYFNASQPANIVFERAQGITGEPAAALWLAGHLIVAATHRCLPDVDDHGEWLLDGRTSDAVTGYRRSLQLRAGDPVAYVPSYYDDGDLTPLLPEQVYLSGYGNCTFATVVASFALAQMATDSLFALYDPGVKEAGLPVQISSQGLTLRYLVDLQGVPALAEVAVQVKADGTVSGIGQVDWSEP